MEIEGGIWLQGRHNRATGFIADMEKYNEATLSGWRIFRLADVHLTLEIVGRIRECIVARESESLAPSTLFANSNLIFAYSCELVSIRAEP
jgi:hypothetical protein